VTRTIATDPPVVGERQAAEVATILQRIGDREAASSIRRALRRTRNRRIKLENLQGRNIAPWEYKSHVFGLVLTPQGGPQPGQKLDIRHAGNVEPDLSLKNATIKITLDRLRVFDYPGKGIHQILFDFHGQHQSSAAKEDLHFSQLYKVDEGGMAGIIGFPVFVGLKVGEAGVAFNGTTVNVRNDGDQKILDFMDSDVFHSGLELIGTPNPVIPVVSGFAVGIVKAFAKRNDNIKVQEFFIGLDFDNTPTRARLRGGSYILVQVPDPAAWDWTKWVYNPDNGQIVQRDDNTKGIPLNYLVFSVSRM
jgi:hypothetical protein